MSFPDRLSNWLDGYFSGGGHNRSAEDLWGTLKLIIEAERKKEREAELEKNYPEMKAAFLENRK